MPVDSEADRNQHAQKEDVGATNNTTMAERGSEGDDGGRHTVGNFTSTSPAATTSVATTQDNIAVNASSVNKNTIVGTSWSNTGDKPPLAKLTTNLLSRNLQSNSSSTSSSTDSFLSPKLNSLISPSPSTTSINTTLASSVARTDTHLLHQRSYLSLKKNQQRYLALTPIQLGLDSSSSDSSSPSPSSATSPSDLNNPAHTHIPLALPGRNPLIPSTHSAITHTHRRSASGGSFSSHRDKSTNHHHNHHHSQRHQSVSVLINSNNRSQNRDYRDQTQYQTLKQRDYSIQNAIGVCPGPPFNTNQSLNQRPSQLRQQVQQQDQEEIEKDKEEERDSQQLSNQIQLSGIPNTITSAASSASSQPTSINWLDTSNQSISPSDITGEIIYASSGGLISNPIDLEYSLTSVTSSQAYPSTTTIQNTNSTVSGNGGIDGGGDGDSSSRHHHFHHHHLLHTPSASVSSLRNMLSGHNLRSDKHKHKEGNEREISREREVEKNQLLPQPQSQVPFSQPSILSHDESSSSTMLKQTLLRHHNPQSTPGSSNNSSASPSCPGSPGHSSVQSTGSLISTSASHHNHHHHSHQTDSTTSLPASSSYPPHAPITSSLSSTILLPASTKPDSLVKETHHISIDYDPVSGRKKLNTYEIIRELGRGQHGKVKLGRKIETGEYVAIKIVDRIGRPRLGRVPRPGSTQEDKIRREIAILKKCNHPNIVRLLEVLDDSSSKKIYLVLEYLEKGEIEWQNEKDQTPVMPRDLVKSTARDVLLGLEYLHFQGIIHRDIKPANLLLSREGVVKISDFGVSYISDYSQDELELAKTAGTPAFFAPELCTEKSETRPPITNKIDIWAFGVTLYCLLFGRVPFIADSEYELFNVILETPLTFPDESEEYKPTQSPAKLDSDMELAKDLLRQMLEKDPGKRIYIPEIKRHPWVCEGMEPDALEKFLHTCDFDNQRIEVTGEEVQEAVRGITGKIKRGLARLGSNALEFAGLRRKSSGSSISSSREPTPLGAQRPHYPSARARGVSDSSGTTPPQRSLLSSGSPLIERDPEARRGSYASAISFSTTETTAGTTPTDKLTRTQSATRRSLSSSQSNLNLNALLERSESVAYEDYYDSNLNLIATTSSLSAVHSTFPPTHFVDDIEECNDYSEDGDDDDDEDDDGELTLTVNPHRRLLPTDSDLDNPLPLRRTPSANVPSSTTTNGRIPSEGSSHYRSRSVGIDAFREDDS